MSACIEFVAYGKPEPKGSTKSFGRVGVDKRTGKQRVFVSTTSDNPNLKDWQTQVAAVAQFHAGALITGPVRLHLSFELPRPKSLPKRVTAHVRKPDLDKLQRAVKDALKGVLYQDDSQVVAVWATKAYGAAPCVRVRVEDLDALSRPDLLLRR